MCREERTFPSYRESDDHRDDFTEIPSEEKDDRFFNVVIDISSSFDRSYDRREVIIGEYHIRGSLRYIGTSDPHSDADICGIERWSIIHSIACHRDDVASLLERLYDEDFVSR